MVLRIRRRHAGIPYLRANRELPEFVITLKTLFERYKIVDVKQHSKLNEEKTEHIVFAPESRIKNLAEFSLSFGKNIIHGVPNVRNLGAHFNQILSFEKKCNGVSKTCYAQIR